MSQHDYEIAAASGASVRADICNALLAIVGFNRGSSAPSTTFVGMEYDDTTLGVRRKRNGANSGWLTVRTLDEAFVVSRSSNTMLDQSDTTKVIRATSGFTQTFDAVATLTDSWHVGYIVDSGATVTLDPSGAETIDGAATKVLVGPVSGFICGNGSALFTIGFTAQTAAATQAEMEAAASTTAMVTPARMQNHPGVVKAHCEFNGTGTPAIALGYNAASITDNGVGNWSVNLSASFSGGVYTPLCGGISAGSLLETVQVASKSASSVNIVSYIANGAGDTAKASVDQVSIWVTCLGDQ